MIGNNKGFTIIELIVVLSIFSIILATVVGIFVVSLQTQRSAIVLVEAQDNLGLALEQMAREIRMGLFDSSSNSLDFDEINFKNASGWKITYKFSEFEGGSIERCVDAECYPITSKNIKVENFYIRAINFGGPYRITMKFIASSKDERLKDIRFNIQTTVSARNI